MTGQVVTEKIAVNLWVGQMSRPFPLNLGCFGCPHEDAHQVIGLGCTCIHGCAFFVDHFHHVLTEIEYRILHSPELCRKHPAREVYRRCEDCCEEIPED